MDLIRFCAVPVPDLEHEPYWGAEQDAIERYRHAEAKGRGEGDRRGEVVAGQQEISENIWHYRLVLT